MLKFLHARGAAHFRPDGAHGDRRRCRELYRRGPRAWCWTVSRRPWRSGRRRQFERPAGCAAARRADAAERAADAAGTARGRSCRSCRRSRAIAHVPFAAHFSGDLRAGRRGRRGWTSKQCNARLEEDDQNLLAQAVLGEDVRGVATRNSRRRWQACGARKASTGATELKTAHQGIGARRQLERGAAVDGGTAVARTRARGARMTTRSGNCRDRAVVYNDLDSPPPGVTGLQWR